MASVTLTPYYRYSVDRLDKHDQLKVMPRARDGLEFRFEVKRRPIGSRRLKFLRNCNVSSSIECGRFFQAGEGGGEDFLRSNLSHPDFPSEWLEQIIPRVISDVQQRFHFNPSLILTLLAASTHPRTPTSTPRVFNLLLNIVLNLPARDGEEEEEEEPPVKEATKRAMESLVVGTFKLPKDHCDICKEKFKFLVAHHHVYDTDTDSAAKEVSGSTSATTILLTMPCGHLFHRQCIPRWLQTNHTCSLCGAFLCPSRKVTLNLDLTLKVVRAKY